MIKRSFRRVVNAAALAALLATASPVSASAQSADWAGWTRAETLFERVWSWLASLGEIPGRTERIEPSDVQKKVGGAIGPEGGGLDGEGGSGDPTCPKVEAGICIDPNG
jgi:hypothetical protein